MSLSLELWRPTLPESRDGLPLATTISDLFLAFPYERLPSNQIVAWSMRPEVMLGLIIFYAIISKPLLKHLIKALDFTGKSAIFSMLVAVHNLSLAVFSAAVAYNAWSIVLLHLREYGWEDTYCDQEGTLWRSGLGAWSTIFYISKYVEFIDTWILVLKGKKPSFLQVYHHSGIVFTMWGAVASQSAWLTFVVLLNSVIHTLMYIYFFIKTLSPKTEIKAAKYLTTAQIVQFYTGILGTLGVLFMGRRCDTVSSRFMLACLDTYGIGLIILFTTFAARKYKTK